MAQAMCPDVIVYTCCNCVPAGGRLPRQWTQDGVRVVVCEIPCSGKIDAQYLLHAFEGGGQGLCVVTCPAGQCQLGQGNYRAEMRIRTVKRMLTEIGLEPERAELLHFSCKDSVDQLEQLVRDAVQRVSACGKTPMAAKR